MTSFWIMYGEDEAEEAPHDPEASAGEEFVDLSIVLEGNESAGPSVKDLVADYVTNKAH